MRAPLALALRRDPALACAAALSAALAATVALAPGAPWRLPLALLAGIWAPGYALLALAYPRGRLAALERHALAACAGLCLVPLLALLASESIGLAGPRVALVSLLATLAFAAGALWRARDDDATETLARSLLPSTRVTVALCAGALVLAAAVEATSFATAREAPASLSLTMGDGPLQLTLEEGDRAVVLVTAHAGHAPRSAPVDATWDGAPLVTEEVELRPGATRALELPLPTGAPGTHQLVVRWGDLQTHARFTVTPAAEG